MKTIQEIKNKTISDIIAFLISVVFSPYIVALTFIIIIIYNSSHDFNQFLPWMITFTLFGLLIPALYVLWQVEIGKISDIRLSIREERKIPFLVTGVSASFGAILLVYLSAAKPVTTMAVTFSVNALIMALVTQYWKISIHLAVFGSVATVAVILYGISFWWLFLILIPLAWSRIHRKRHTLPQTVAGALLAILLTTIVFWAFGYL